jgi:exopolyphosphatase/guanosine-5'-triphosphate,3'-diphosphate pyrophosphatase
VAAFADRIRQAGADRVRFVATSAARDASNRDAFFSGVRERLGVDAEIISGDEEARLSFTGALSATSGVGWPVLVMDIGGGSTELVLGRPGASGAVEILAARSLDIGSVRLRERFLHSDPPTPAEVGAASGYIDDLLAGCGVPIETAASWIGVGGTATSLSAINLGLDAYDRTRVHGSTMARDEVQALAARLLAAPVAEVLEIPTMQPKRADVICAGALITARVGARCPVDLGISEADILDGIVLDLLARP